jgi:hypothetical protein
MVQVGRALSTKHEVLSSNTSTAKKEKKKKKQTFISLHLGNSTNLTELGITRACSIIALMKIYQESHKCGEEAC